MMKKNDRIELVIEDMSADGDGVGHYDGFTFFVKDVVVGDHVEAVIMKLKKNYGYARMVRLIKASPDRVMPTCSVARSCGGCQLRHMSDEACLSFKSNLVINHMKRIAGIPEDSYTYEGIEPMINPLRYRNKAQYPVGVNKEGDIITGFYAKHSHNIIQTEDCELASPLNREIVAAVKAYMTKYGIMPYEEGKGLVRHIVIRNSAALDQVMVCLVIAGKTLPHKDALIEELRKFPQITSVMLNINTTGSNVILTDKTELLWGAPYIQDHIGDRVYQISLNSFFQVNPYMTRKMYDKIVEYVAPEGHETVWDLYCGTGTISLYVAPHVKSVCGVEIVEKAIEDAKTNAKLNNITNATFYAGKSEDIVTAYYEEHKDMKADVIIVDPPRKGCDETLLETIIKINPKKLVYMSCDSATLARDAKYLSEHGYKLMRMKCFDNFYGTVHVETVVLMSKVNTVKG